MNPKQKRLAKQTAIFLALIGVPSLAVITACLFPAIGLAVACTVTAALVAFAMWSFAGDLLD